MPKIETIAGMKSDGKGTVTFEFHSADGRKHFVPMGLGAINALVPAILNIAKSTDEEGRPTKDVQPVTLTGARAAVMEGRPAMDIWLDGIPLSVELSESAIEGLRKVLEAAQGEAALRTGTRH